MTAYKTGRGIWEKMFVMRFLFFNLFDLEHVVSTVAVTLFPDNTDIYSIPCQPSKRCLQFIGIKILNQLFFLRSCQITDPLALLMIAFVYLSSLDRCQSCPFVNGHGISSFYFLFIGNPENVNNAILTHN